MLVFLVRLLPLLVCHNAQTVLLVRPKISLANRLVPLALLVTTNLRLVALAVMLALLVPIKIKVANLSVKNAQLVSTMLLLVKSFVSTVLKAKLNL
jgi:hypothetical protein